TYNMAGSRGDGHETWISAAFPAVIANCVVCHTEAVAGTLADVNNWKNVPSRASCGSCHDLINWTTGVGHAGGLATSDDNCTLCHKAASISYAKSVTTAHDFANSDIRNIPEFSIALTTDTPARGYYIAGESPVITMVLTPRETDAAAGYTAGVPIDHTKVVYSSTREGCTPNADLSACTNPSDGKFNAANLYVTGPRAKRIQVLTTAARAKVSSATTGPWDLSAGGSLRLIVDGGNFITKFGHGPAAEDVLVPGDFTVTLPAGALTATATAADVVAWLNGSGAEFEYNERAFEFSDRAIAYVEDGKVSIRTRAVGTDNPTIQIPDLAKSLGIFTDTAVRVAGRSTAVYDRPGQSDPKAVRTAANIQYTLDPVDDLPAGTYMINVEFADRSRGTGNGIRTPSIAVATFQVKQAGVEKPIADGCTSCHWSTPTVGAGSGFVLDPVRHNKPFNAQAIDQCAGCHDYASNETVAARTWTTGGSTKPISKRVHAAHRGASLNYPVLTVDHEDTTIGRNWQITFPMDIRNCESCHPAATVSGTWKTNPNRLACMGCHDTDAATAHMQAQVTDPTPTAPWSGDEKESCAACH
ncbi:MAG: cytochrome C, partial [Pseudomonadota bacterium]